MSPYFKATLIILGIVSVSTSFYVYYLGGDKPPAVPECTITPDPTLPEEKVKDTHNYMCNVAVAIYSTPGHANTRVADARKSWTKRICPYGKPQYMFIGLPDDLHIERSVDVPCKTDYFSLCCKSMEGLARLYNTYPNADWYYKVDDDTLLVPKNVDEMLAKQDPNDKLLLGYTIEAEIDPVTKKFAGRIYEPRKDHHNGELFPDSIFYCSGSAYVMSRGLVQGMMQNMTKYKEVWDPICTLYEPEDVAVGLFAAKFGARVGKIFGVYNKGWNWEEGPADNTYEVASVHLSRDTQKMVLLDRLLSGIPPTPGPETLQF